MSKLYPLKGWYSIAEAAARLSKSLAEPVTDADLIQLAAENQIKVCWFLNGEYYANQVLVSCPFPQERPSKVFSDLAFDDDGDCWGEALAGIFTLPVDLCPAWGWWLLTFIGKGGESGDLCGALVVGEDGTFWELYDDADPASDFFHFPKREEVVFRREDLEAFEHSVLGIDQGDQALPLHGALEAPQMHWAKERIMHTETVELSLGEAIRLEDAAVSLGCSVHAILVEAAAGQRLLYAALGPHTATLSAVPSHPSPRAAKYETKGHKIVALLPQYAESLAIAKNVNVAMWQAAFDGGPLDWHYWRLDVPQTVTLDMIFVPKSSLHVESDLPLSSNPISYGTGSDEQRTVKAKWVEKAHSLASAYIVDWQDHGYEPVGEDAAVYVANIFRLDGTRNTRGNVIDCDTIKREALSGITGRKPGERIEAERKIPEELRKCLPPNSGLPPLPRTK